MRPVAALALAGALLSAGFVPAAAQSPGPVDAGTLERICEQEAPDESTRERCLLIVRTVLAPDGTLVLPAADASPSPEGPGIGTTQATQSLRVTLLDVEWEAALWPSDDVEIVAAEFAFESTHPEAYVDPGGLFIVDGEGFSHGWGAIHRMGASPTGGFLGEGRRQRGWVGFEIPPGADRIELEYVAAGGERLVWSVAR